jgi:hypothetical protein
VIACFQKGDSPLFPIAHESRFPRQSAISKTSISFTVNHCEPVRTVFPSRLPSSVFVVNCRPIALIAPRYLLVRATHFDPRQGFRPDDAIESNSLTAKGELSRVRICTQGSASRLSGLERLAVASMLAAEKSANGPPTTIAPFQERWVLISRRSHGEYSFTRFPSGQPSSPLKFERSIGLAVWGKAQRGKRVSAALAFRCAVRAPVPYFRNRREASEGSSDAF